VAVAHHAYNHSGSWSRVQYPPAWEPTLLPTDNARGIARPEARLASSQQPWHNIAMDTGLAGTEDRPRVILHLDLDAFFAAVEALENPALAGKPVIVGGRPEDRGVIASASYEARAYGVRSAMPTGRALTLCPSAILVPPRHRIYRRYSRHVMEILHAASPLVEQMSIDEAYLDLSAQVEDWPSAVHRAQALQQQVLLQTKLSASIGVASNKLVAKVASDRDKPGGLTVVRPGEEAAFLAPLPVRVLWGIGPVTARRLAEMGVQTVGQLALVDEPELVTRFGQHGSDMARMALGIDHRPVVTEHEAKSISQERTFRRDLANGEALTRHLWQQCQEIGRRLEAAGLTAGTVAIKLRYADFETITRQMSLDVPTADEKRLYRATLTLLRRAWDPARSVRLLGVAAHRLSPPPGQLSLW
jgi:DNA polymerase-4